MEVNLGVNEGKEALKRGRRKGFEWFFSSKKVLIDWVFELVYWNLFPDFNFFILTNFYFTRGEHGGEIGGESLKKQL